jgi:hypothetical protein
MKDHIKLVIAAALLSIALTQFLNSQANNSNQVDIEPEVRIAFTNWLNT